MWEDFGKALTNVAFAGVGLAALAAEQVVKAGKVLAEKGEIYVEQGKRYGEELQQKLQEDAQRRREEQLEQRISAMDAKRGGLVAARDPIGIRPLYYGYDAEGAIIFASEAKNLVGLVHDVMPFPPGHYYADGKFTCYRDMTQVDAVCEDDLDRKSVV